MLPRSAWNRVISPDAEMKSTVCSPLKEESRSRRRCIQAVVNCKRRIVRDDPTVRLRAARMEDVVALVRARNGHDGKRVPRRQITIHVITPRLVSMDVVLLHEPVQSVCAAVAGGCGARAARNVRIKFKFNLPQKVLLGEN